jgi:Kef-type K+ transport system membrane component KefB
VNLVVLVLLALLMHSVRSFSVGTSSGSAGTSLAFGYLLLTAYFAGRVFAQLKLPKLTGYLAAGIVAGPGALGLLTDHMAQSLKLVNGMAVALIALTAGSELELRVMRPLMRSIWWITLTAVIGTTVLLAAVVWFARDLLPFVAHLTITQTLAVALVLGVVMVAQSPAVVVALRDETLAEGPLVRTVLGVVVIADLVVIVMFTGASAIAKAALGGPMTTGATVAALVWELLGSLVVGAAIGYVLSLYLRKVRTGAALFLLTVAFIVAEIGQRLGLDPLLVALAAGMLIRNATTVGDALRGQIEVSAVPVYVLFFAAAGADLQLEVLAVMGIPALLFVLVRAAGLLAGARLATTLAGAPEAVRRYVGYGLLPQAGLALALSVLFARTFPEFGRDAAALTLSVVAINELVMPAIYRFALLKSGEAGAMQRVPPAVGHFSTARPASDGP